MALLFGELKRHVRMRTANKLDEVRVDNLLRDKIKAVWLSNTWSFRQKPGTLITKAPISAGTVTLDADLTKVNGTGTGWTADVVGMTFRLADLTPLSTVTAINTGTQQLTLESAYALPAFTNSTYRLYQATYALASDFAQMIAPVGWWRLEEGTITSIANYDPQHTFFAQEATQFVYRGENASGVPLIELSPLPSIAIGINYNYYSKPPLWTDALLVPIREDVLTWGVAAEGLYILALEEPTRATDYAAIAQTYEAKGIAASQEFAFDDAKLQGIQKAVHDDGGWSLMNDDYLTNHDLFSPV